ncbi:MAG: hypothetical protein LBM38_01460 [Clostridiales bacterium]|nr:hypothetical protein [Clostridiales bacterium]
MKKKTWIIIAIVIVLIGGGVTWVIAIRNNKLAELQNASQALQPSPATQEAEAPQSPVPTATASPNKAKDYSAILADVNKWQAYYFENVLGEYSDSIEFPRHSLEGGGMLDENSGGFFRELEKEVKGYPFYQHWLSIVERNYSFMGVNNDAKSRNAAEAADEMDALLNTVYQQIRREIPEADFKELQKAEQKWLDDCEAFSRKNFTMSYEASYFEWSAKSFRTLLLLKYFG